MITGTRRRRLGLLTVGLIGSAALAGCGSDVEGEASPGTSSSASSSAASSSAASGSAAGESAGTLEDAEDLSAGLLPAEAFGSGAQVTPISADQIEQQAQLGGLGGQEGLTITPEACAPAVKGVQPGLDDVAGLAAQTATAGSTTTVEILAAGAGIAQGGEDLASTAQTFPQAPIPAPPDRAPQATFAAPEGSEVGDAAARVS